MSAPTTALPMNGDTTKKDDEKIILIKGPTFSFQGRQVTLSGQIRYDPQLTQEVEPDWSIVNELESDLAAWLAKEYKGEEGQRAMEELAIFKNRKDVPLWSYYTCRTLWGNPGSKDSKGKMLTLAKFYFLSFLWDELFELSTQEPTSSPAADDGPPLGSVDKSVRDRRQQLFETCEPLMSKLYSMQFITKSQLRDKFLATPFGQEQPQYVVHLTPLLQYMKEFIVSYNLLHPQQVKETFYSWWKHVTLNPRWAEQSHDDNDDANDDDKSNSRIAGSGETVIYPTIRVLAMLDGLRPNKVTSQDENICKLEILACAIERNLNDVVSLEREILEGEVLNDILIACHRKGLDFETALAQHFQEGDLLRVQFQNCFNSIVENYRNNNKEEAGIRRYVEIVGAATAALWPIHSRYQGRFSKLDTCVVSSH